MDTRPSTTATVRAEVGDELPVRGRRHDRSGVRAYVLDARLNGHDSYRTARLRLAGRPIATSPVAARRPNEPSAGNRPGGRRTAGGRPSLGRPPADPAADVRVRVLTLDDVTLICPLPDQPDLPDRWEGTLVLPPAGRGPAMPADLLDGLLDAGLDPTDLEAASRRHLIGFVAEARPGPTRTARIASPSTPYARTGRRRPLTRSAVSLRCRRTPRTAMPAGHRSAVPPTRRRPRDACGHTPSGPRRSAP